MSISQEGVTSDVAGSLRQNERAMVIVLEINVGTVPQRARDEGWKIGIKTVRGAYIIIEQKRAASLGYEDPIQPSLEATHVSYDRSAVCALQTCRHDCC